MIKKKIEIEGLKTEYWATDTGLIYSTKSKKFLKPTLNHKGYNRVDFYINGAPKKLFVHRLILSTFNPVDNMEELQVNHINGNKNDNRLCNLEWSNNLDNIRHSYHNNNRDLEKISGINNPSNKLTEKEVKEIINKILDGFPKNQIALEYNVSKSLISAIESKRLWGNLTKDIDFKKNTYEDRYTNDEKEYFCKLIKENKTTSELLELTNLKISEIKYFKQKVKYNF